MIEEEEIATNKALVKRNEQLQEISETKSGKRLKKLLQLCVKHRIRWPKG